MCPCAPILQWHKSDNAEERRACSTCDCNSFDAADPEAPVHCSVLTGSSDLEIPYNGNGADRIVAIRFRNVYIPRGATIESAKIAFSVDEVHTPPGQIEPQTIAGAAGGSNVMDDCDPRLGVVRSGRHCSTNPVTVTIYAESEDNPEEFLEEDNNLSRRPSSGNQVQWAIEPWTQLHQIHETVDFSRIIREVVTRRGWTAGNSIVIMFRHSFGRGSRWAEAYLGGTPALEIGWTGPTMHLYSSGQDSFVCGQYAEEQPQNNGHMAGYSNDLELGYEGAAEGDPVQPNHVVMRFSNIFVPAEAEISGARIKFNIDEVEPAHSPISLRITAQAVPDADRVKCDYGANACSNFNDSPDCVGGCPRHMISDMIRGRESVLWSPRPWMTVHEDEKTPDISAVIQEVIDQDGWAAGNSINIIIEPVMDGTTGSRVAEAGSVFGPPPQLEITWAFHTPETRMALHDQQFGEEMTPECAAQCADPRVTLDSSDLEMPVDSQGCPGNDPADPTPGDFDCEQVVAIRFPTIEVPEGAHITHAYMTFDVDEIDPCQTLDPTTCRQTLEDGTVVNGEASDVTLWIQGSAEDSAAPICPQGENGCADGRAPQGSIINRPRTTARVEWTPVPWRVLHQLQRTVDVGPILQEITARPGWQEGNAIMIYIGKASGIGSRVAESDRSSFPSLTYSFTFDGMEVDGYAAPAPGVLATVQPGGNLCNEYCLDDGVQSPNSIGHTEVLTTQACADLCDTTDGCFAFEYHPWLYYCRLISTTLDLSGETELHRSTTQFYYEKLEAGGHAVTPCADTSAINTACPGAEAGQVVPRACGAACANVFMPWWNRCSTDEGVMSLDSSNSRAFTQ
jgi:hypothetical protein